MRYMTVLFSLGFSFLADVSLAADKNDSQLSIENSWARPTRGLSRVTAVYMEIKNQSDQALVLDKVTSPLGHAMIHESVTESGLVRMKHLDGLSIPAKSQVLLKPGSYHIMITGLQKALQAGESVDLSLSFKKAGIRKVKVTVIDK
jgi:copper(I)-binding protein